MDTSMHYIQHDFCWLVHVWNNTHKFTVFRNFKTAIIKKNLDNLDNLELAYQN